MKKFYLSTTSERTTGVVFSVAMSAVLLILPYVLREDLMVLLFTLAGVALIIAGLALYAVNVVKATVTADAQNKKLHVDGFRKYTIDLSNAVLLETVAVKNGRTQSRNLVFTDAQENIVARIPTYFTSNNGVEAEPMAMELAQVLGLEFRANVPAWEYDEEARKAHDIEVAQQEKEEAKARREAKQKALEAKFRKKINEVRNEKK